jgi:hypothetical protein
MAASLPQIAAQCPDLATERAQQVGFIAATTSFDVDLAPKPAIIRW